MPLTRFFSWRLVTRCIGILLIGVSQVTIGAVAQGDIAHNKDMDKAKTNSPANVLILMFDDMRFDTFSYRGGPVSTPNIDALAAESTRFDNAMSTTGLCSPSRAAFYTGKWGHKTGLDDNVELYHTRLAELDLNEGGLIKKASDAGYLVGHVGKWHLGARGTELRGAEIDLAHGHEPRERYSRVYTPTNKVEQVKGYYEGKLDANNEKHEYYRTLAGSYEDTEAYKKVVAGKKMLTQMANDERPFFGVISFNQPHPAYRVPEPYASMYNPNELALPDNHLAKRVNKPMAQGEIWWPWHDVGHMSDTDWRKARAHYYGAIAMVDRIVGELIQQAKDEGIYEDLHIVLFGDQGSMLGEHTLYDKGPYAYDELMRMPLLIKNPNIAPRVVNRQVSLIDVTPTLAEIMQVGIDPEYDGHTLLPLMEQGDKAEEGRIDKALYAYEWYNGSWFGIRAIRTPEYKFVWNPGEDLDELYDLRKDPAEMTNQIDNQAYAKPRAEMVRLLMSELKRTEDPALSKLEYHAKPYLKDSNNEKPRH
ncbi:sulfatase-like hydrolase/transferase [Alteromonas stellipolaris]|jgi:arylsulfatase A-like enzyme|uniref:sulfatase-like hydrolase/transferase n=1 Tax=Alteromonas stellipolaris TaxID=233316 RepID=UPI002734F1C5|nr:sulfatase-like hydrolase/transferase [Alteromonas stellipolaris]MDP2537125.1 sulfatase-like hydrolase/transferase [Alteromonas stellipolaris]MDP2596913.1 sulfatase-like hydrolase/transferase [Alteromonas stellipolaris]